MLSHHRFLTLILLLLTPIMIGSFVLYQRSHSCVHTDRVFCSFIAELDREDFEESHGTFISQMGDKASKVNWSLGKDSKQIQVFTEGHESMNMIVIGDTVYVKDYTDGLWWKQPKKEMDGYVFELSFDPDVFIQEVLAHIDDPKLKLGKHIEIQCKEKKCVQYTLSIDNFKHIEFISIDPQDNKLLQYAGKTDEISTAFNVIYEKQMIEVPTQTKNATKGQNILLDQMISVPTEQSAKDLEYVREFEQQMKQNK